MNAILALRGVFSPSKTAKTLEWGRGGWGGGDDASVLVTNQVQIFAAVVLGKQFDGHNKSNYCLYQL